MILTEKILEEILEYLDPSIANLAKDTLSASEFQTIGNLEHFLSNQYDIRLSNLLHGKNSDIHHLESGMKNKTIQRKLILFEKLKKELPFK
jgi:hypothetical protein